MCITQTSTVTVFCNTQIHSAAVYLILTAASTVSVCDTVISICTVYNTQMYPAAGDLTVASTVTSCVSHNHSSYLTLALMRGTVCLHNSNATGRDTQFRVEYL